MLRFHYLVSPYQALTEQERKDIDAYKAERPANLPDYLVEHGINTIASDLLIHVGVVAQMIYVFDRRAVKRLCKLETFAHVPEYTDSRITAYGYLVPIEKLLRLAATRAQRIPSGFFVCNRIHAGMPKSRAGKIALSIAFGALVRSQIDGDPLVDDAGRISFVRDVTLQRQGKDLLIETRKGVTLSAEVKCDRLCGETRDNASGNAYIQTFEVNDASEH